MQDPEVTECESMPCAGYHQGKYAEDDDGSLHAHLEILASNYPYLGNGKPIKWGKGWLR